MATWVHAFIFFTQQNFYSLALVNFYKVRAKLQTMCQIDEKVYQLLSDLVYLLSYLQKSVSD